MKSPVPVFLALILALNLTSCKEAQEIQTQRNEARAKMESLVAESNQLEQKLGPLRRAFPGVNSPQVAQGLAEKSQKQLEIVQQDITKAVHNYEETEASLKSLEAELASLSR